MDEDDITADLVHRMDFKISVFFQVIAWMIYMTNYLENAYLSETATATITAELRKMYFDKNCHKVWASTFLLSITLFMYSIGFMYN